MKEKTNPDNTLFAETCISTFLQCQATKPVTIQGIVAGFLNFSGNQRVKKHMYNLSARVPSLNGPQLHAQFIVL